MTTPRNKLKDYRDALRAIADLPKKGKNPHAAGYAAVMVARFILAEHGDEATEAK